jgi:hypothetical protein
MKSDLQEVLQSRIIVRSHEPGGPYFIDLMHDGALYFAFGPYIHPGVAGREAARLRDYIELILKPAQRAVELPGAPSLATGPHKTVTTLVTKEGVVEQAETADSSLSRPPSVV